MSQATSQQPVVDYGRKTRPSIGQWFNLRIAVFVLVVGGLIGYAGYTYFQEQWTQGIQQRGDLTVVNLKAMSTFPFDQKMGVLEDIPERYRALNGKKVELIGEMYAPESSGAAVDKFDLVYSIQKSCYSGEPLVQHFVRSKGTAGPVPFYGGQVRITGTLRVEVEKDADKITGIYHLMVDKVDPV